MLAVECLEAGYGDVPVLHGISLEVREGEIYCRPCARRRGVL